MLYGVYNSNIYCIHFYYHSMSPEIEEQNNSGIFEEKSRFGVNEISESMRFVRHKVHNLKEIKSQMQILQTDGPKKSLKIEENKARSYNKPVTYHGVLAKNYLKGKIWPNI